jgi:dihydrofolate reductase
VFPRPVYRETHSSHHRSSGAEDFSFTMVTVDGYYKGPNHKTEWANTRLISDTEDVRALKQQPGKDIAILASSDLTVSLLQMGLVDELRIRVSPLILGAGKSVFRNAGNRISLKLLRSRLFNSGNVLLYYQPVPAGQQPQGP